MVLKLFIIWCRSI